MHAFPQNAGWLPDEADHRDYTIDHDEIARFLEATQITPAKIRESVSLPQAVDLRPWCSPVFHQEGINACTANVVAAIAEYMNCRAAGTYEPLSRLFLYKATRDLLQVAGNQPIRLRSTARALHLFGTPPEKYWPYVEESVNKEPAAFHYALAAHDKIDRYAKLDPMHKPKAEILTTIKMHLTAGFPLTCGFAVCYSMGQATATGKIPFPTPKEKKVFGHAVMVAGYDDQMAIANTGELIDKAGDVIANTGERHETKGAFLIRNSWGNQWGEGGYGWLPYDYLLQGKAADFWVLFKQTWLDSGRFVFSPANGEGEG